MHKMQELLDYRQALLERFGGVVEDLQAAARRLEEGQFRSALEASRSAHPVIAHLLDVERQAYWLRMERILSEDCPQLPVFDAEAWARERYQPTEPLELILEEYAQLRRSELERLQFMPPGGWSRQGRHPAYGLRTLQWWVEKSLAHSEEHLRSLQGYLRETGAPGKL